VTLTFQDRRECFLHSRTPRVEPVANYNNPKKSAVDSIGRNKRYREHFYF